MFEKAICRVSFSICPRGNKMRLYELMGRGGSTYPCAKHVANKAGMRACFPRKF